MAILRGGIVVRLVAHSCAATSTSTTIILLLLLLVVVDCIGPVLRQLDSMALALATAIAAATTPKLGVLPVSLEVYYRQTLPTQRSTD